MLSKAHSYLPIAARTGNAEKCSAVRAYIENSSPPALLSCPAAFLCMHLCKLEHQGIYIVVDLVVCVFFFFFNESISYHHSLFVLTCSQVENAIMRYDNKAHS